MEKKNGLWSDTWLLLGTRDDQADRQLVKVQTSSVYSFNNGKWIRASLLSLWWDLCFSSLFVYQQTDRGLKYSLRLKKKYLWMEMKEMIVGDHNAGKAFVEVSLRFDLSHVKNDKVTRLRFIVTGCTSAINKRLKGVNVFKLGLFWCDLDCSRVSLGFDHLIKLF